LKVFFAQTAPLIDYYTRIGKLVEVNGVGAVEDVRKGILKTLKRGNAGRK
jgi:adenylate kinase family enzyme